jgi:pyridoxine 4-dehydrogenase
MKRSMRPWPAAARTSTSSAQRRRRSSEIAKRHGATSTQIALASLLRRSPAMLPIRGTVSLGHLRENLAALEIELTDAEFDALR